jgi:hypothetical protein
MIAALVDDDPIPAWLGGERRWTRVYGRTASETRATLVYEPEAGANEAVCVELGDGGVSVGGLPQVRAMRWTEDPALPALKPLTCSRDNLRAIRYRPHKRCTMRLDGQLPLFLKCVADGRGEAINRDARLLHEVAKDGLLGFGVARPAGWLSGSRIIAQHEVPGTSVVERLWAANGDLLAEKLGQANATLALTPLQPSPRFTYAYQLKRTQKYAARLRKRLPDAVEPLDQLLHHLAKIKGGLANRPIHGAPHAHQWLDGSDGPMLVDFDRFSLGDPELDAATFAAEADFENAAHAGEVGASFVRGYDSVVSLDGELLLAYRLHKHIAKALRTLTAVRTDAETRTLKILDRAALLAKALP